MRCMLRLRSACCVGRQPILAHTHISSYHPTTAACSIVKPAPPTSAASRVTITPLDSIDSFFESGPSWSVHDSFNQADSQSDSDSAADDITDEDLQHLGNLTALHVDLTTTHGQQLRTDVKMMVRWLSQLKEVDTEGVEPMWTPLQMIEKQSRDENEVEQQDNSAALSPRYREDKAVRHPNPAELLANAPHTASGYVLVPKILGAEDDG